MPPLAIFLLALGVRLVYLCEIESLPLFHHPAGDSRGYDEWAQRIAAGDWWGEGVFYQAPLYPYFLGVLQSVFGHDLWSIRVVQVTLGAASCSLLYWATSLWFSRGAGVAAGVMLALYGPAIFFDGLIQKTVLDLVLISLMLVLLGRMGPEGPALRWSGIGAIVGLLGLARENALAWVAVPPVWIWLHDAGPRRARALRIGGFVLGVALVLFPVGLRNRIAGGEFALTTSQLGPNLFIGNNPHADGGYMALRPGHGSYEFERLDATELAEQASGRRLSPREVSHYWVGCTVDWVRSEPIAWVGLMWRKWWMTWNVRELEDTDDYYFYRQHSWVLSILGTWIHFGLLAPLAALGLVATWSGWRRLWILYALVATFAASVALFYVFGRYRLPLVPLLAVFAGAGIVDMWSRVRERRLQRAWLPGAVLVASLVAVHWPLAGLARTSAAALSNLGIAYARQGRMAEAIESQEAAIALEPGYAVARYNLGNLLGQQGRLAEARQQLAEALRLSPGYAEAHNSLGNVALLQGDLPGAVREYQQAVALSPRNHEAHFNLGNALLQQGRLDEAVACFRRCIGIDPRLAEAHEGLGRALGQQGKPEEASRHLQEAARLRQGPR